MSYKYEDPIEKGYKRVKLSRRVLKEALPL